MFNDFDSRLTHYSRRLSAFQDTNKKIAKIQSEQAKGGEGKFVMTDEAWSIEHHRSDKLGDFF